MCLCALVCLSDCFVLDRVESICVKLCFCESVFVCVRMCVRVPLAARTCVYVGMYVCKWACACDCMYRCMFLFVAGQSTCTFEKVCRPTSLRDILSAVLSMTSYYCGAVYGSKA